MLQNNRLVLLLLLLLCATQIFAQGGRTITGVVNDNAGLPVPSATVTVKGTKQSTVTDAGGRYSIAVPGDNAVLVFSAISFGTREIPVGSSNVLDVSLELTAGDLEGVVVTALGVSRQKKALGYASTTIASDELTKTATPNFATALYGKA